MAPKDDYRGTYRPIRKVAKLHDHWPHLAARLSKHVAVPRECLCIASLKTGSDITEDLECSCMEALSRLPCCVTLPSWNLVSFFVFLMKQHYSTKSTHFLSFLFWTFGLAMEVSANQRPRTVIGPLSTTFTPPSSCTNVIAGCPYSCSSGYVVSARSTSRRVCNAACLCSCRAKHARHPHIPARAHQQALQMRPIAGHQPHKVHQRHRLPSLDGVSTAQDSSARQAIRALAQLQKAGQQRVDMVLSIRCCLVKRRSDVAQGS